MNKLFLYLVLSVLLIACKKQDQDTVDAKKDMDSSSSDSSKKKFEMYQMSEMAALMEQMYAHNASLKEKIAKGEPITGKLPDFFQNIHTAKFTDESDNDLFFKQNASLFLNTQELLYSDSKNAKEHYNAAIDACITCHKSKCGGPIPRIKKLYLK